MVAGGDPVANGLVESLAKPGGNVTGLSQMLQQLAGKRLKLLKEMVPKLSDVAVLWNPQSASATLNWKENQQPARQLGIQLHSYHPSVLLKLYIYGYLNRIRASRRLEREAQRNVELMWLTGRLAPDCKTIADFRRSNGDGTRNVCRKFIVLCRQLKLFSQGVVAIDGSKFKAVNSRDRNSLPAKIGARKEQIERSIKRYLDALETADRT